LGQISGWLLTIETAKFLGCPIGKWHINNYSLHLGKEIMYLEAGTKGEALLLPCRGYSTFSLNSHGNQSLTMVNAQLLWQF